MLGFPRAAEEAMLILTGREDLQNHCSDKILPDF